MIQFLQVLLMLMVIDKYTFFSSEFMFINKYKYFF